MLNQKIVRVFSSLMTICLTLNKYNNLSELLKSNRIMIRVTSQYYSHFRKEVEFYRDPHRLFAKYPE